MADGDMVVIAGSHEITKFCRETVYFDDGK